MLVSMQEMMDLIKKKLAILGVSGCFQQRNTMLSNRFKRSLPSIQHNYGTSPFFMGKFSINGDFQ